jgi:hypothetical protein
LEIHLESVRTAYIAKSYGESHSRSRGTRDLVGWFDAGQQAKRGRDVLRCHFSLISVKNENDVPYHNILGLPTLFSDEPKIYP